MRHLNDGTLRQVHDDRFAASNRDREHLDGCKRCRRAAESVAADAALAGRLLTAPVGPAGAAEPALHRLRAHVASGARPPVALQTPGMPRRRWAIGLVAVPLVGVALVGTASAAGWLSIFAPTQVAPVVLTAADVSGLPDLSAYGRMQVTQPWMTAVSGAAEAAAASGLHVLRPSSLPADVPSTVQWEVIGHGRATFTLDSAAARAAGRGGRGIPSSLDGASVTVDGGPGVLAVYGQRPNAAPGSLSGLPTLVIAEVVRPTASTTGATLAQLQDALLAQPGISPALAAAIRAIGQPGSTLPIPVVSGLMTSRTITLSGVPAVVVGDSTGLGAAVIWEKDGIVHAVAGTLAESEVVDIARSLH